MKNFALLVIVSLIFSSCDIQDSIPTQEEAEKAILAKENNSLDLWAQGDPVGFSNNFADDATYFDDIAAHTRIDGREEFEKYFKSLEGNIPPHSYKLVDPKIQVYGNIAILTLQYHSTLADGQSGPPWKATSVYRFSNGDWQVVHAHWSLVKE